MLELFPILASLATLGLYFAVVNFVPWVPPLDGFLIALLATVLLAIINNSSATAEGANIQAYNMLRSGQNELSARLGVLNSGPFSVSRQEVKAAFELDYLGRQSIAALLEAYTAFHATSESLSKSGGSQWAKGTGYVYTWGMIHRAEEALMEVDALPIVIREAIRDRLDLEGSAVENRNDLLKELEMAVKDLDPDAVKYLKKSQDDMSFVGLLEEIRTLRLHGSLDGPEHEIDRNVQDQPMQPSPIVQARARATLRQVKHGLNKFREDRLAELIQARNNLELSIVATGSITYILLTMAILTQTGFTSADRQVLIGATVYYIIGATVGLFGRLYNESLATSAVNDYGLSLRRLMATPLLSGLAAVGGVVIFETLISQSTPTADVLVLPLFAVTPYFLLIAAVFGLTPNLLIKGLQERSNKVLSDFESARTGGVASSNK